MFRFLNIRLLGVLFSIGTFSQAQNVSIPDPAFEQFLINLGFDTDGVLNGEMSQSDASAIQILFISNTASPITDLTGLASMPNLQVVNITGTSVPALDLSGVSVSICMKFNQDNSLQQVVVGPNMVDLTIGSCPQLNTIDLTNANGLEDLAVNNCQVSSLDLTTVPNLTRLSVGSLPMSTITLPQQPFTQLGFGNLPLVIPDLSGFTQLEWLIAQELPNQTELDLRSNPLGQRLDIEDNPALTRVLLNNGNNINMGESNIQNNPLLTCIAVDDVSYAQNNWTITPHTVDAGAFAAMVPPTAPCATVGLVDVQRRSVVAHPVPATGSLHWSGLDDAARARLLDLNGRQVLQLDDAWGGPGLDISSLPAGVYLLVLEQQNKLHNLRVVIE